MVTILLILITVAVSLLCMYGRPKLSLHFLSQFGLR